MVAPIRVSSPSSTAGSSASCWALLKRWISSRKRIVGRPLARRRSRARSITARISALPALTADSSSKAPSAPAAAIRASVVFPEPGRPVEDRAVRMAALDRRPQRRALAEHVLLPDQLVEAPRPHPHRQRSVGREPGCGGRSSPLSNKSIRH